MDNEVDPNISKEIKPEESADSTTVNDLEAVNTTENLSETPEVPKKKRFSFPKISLNRNTILAGSLALLLVIIGVVTLVLTRDGKVDNTQEEVVVVNDESEKLGVAILLSEGTLQTKPIDSGDWEDATTETEIGEGVALRTVGATSRTVIAFDDGSALRLDANSEAELEVVRVDRIVVKHKAGYTYNRVLPSDSLKYVVTSEDAQYEALGTAFKTATTGDEQSVEVYHSSVVETNTNKTPKEGEKLIVLNKANPSENGNIEKLDIETVKNDAFIQWNKELDEKDENYKNSLGFLKDFEGPDITLNKNDGDVVLLEPDATEGTIEISGKTESGAKLTVLSKSQSGSQPIEVAVGGDGNFVTPVLTAPVGDSVFEFVAKDRSGNATTKTLRITFQRKSQPVAGNAVSFVLSAKKNDPKYEFSWSLKGIESPDGVKIVYSKSDTPIFGASGVGSAYKESGTSSSIKFSEFSDGSGTYYVKACIYDKASGTCGQYSNQITVDIP